MYLSIEFKADAAYRLINTLKLVPFVVDAHDEVCDWRRLSTVVQMLGGVVRGFGIPNGGGLVYHPDQTVEAIRRRACEVSMVEGVPSTCPIRSTHPLS